MENKKIIEYIQNYPNEIKTIAEFIKNNYHADKIQNYLKEKTNCINACNYMWNWEIEPKSIAHGILDDITYDWIEIIYGMLKTGGISVILNENDIINANKQSQKTTNIKVDYTGSSGIAGVIKLSNLKLLNKDITNIATVFTGIERH